MAFPNNKLTPEVNHHLAYAIENLSTVQIALLNGDGAAALLEISKASQRVEQANQALRSELRALGKT